MSAGFIEPVALLAGLVLMAECFLGREEVPVRFWCLALINDTHSPKNTANKQPSNVTQDEIRAVYFLLERILSMSSLMDAVLRASRVSGMTLSDLLSDLADVLGDEVLLRLDDVTSVSDALALSHVSGVTLNEVLGRENKEMVIGFHSDETPGDMEERLRWMNALDSFLDDQAIPE